MIRIGPAWLPKTEYVSFDIFDTLVKRSVAVPTDVFVLVERYCTKEKKDLPAGFAQKRRAAELRARERKGTSTCLDDIYEELSREYGSAADELKALELQLELAGCQANLPYTELLKRCMEAGKKVFLISDMYLSSAFIGKMLDKCGIRGYERLYVSCEQKAEKRDGSLFRVVMEEFHLYPRQIYHIGDNWRADYLVPLSLGIRAAHIDGDRRTICKRPKGLPEEEALTYRTLQACIRDCSQGMGTYEKLGCGVFGPQLYGFTQWLLKRLREDDIHDVYFMARDGYAMKQAFDELGAAGIRTHYLYCSRRSYQVPVIWRHSQFDEAVRPFSYSKRMTLRELLTSLGLSPEAYAEMAKEYDVDLDRIYEKGGIYKDKRVRALYEVIQRDVEKNSKEEYDALVAYLRSLGMQGQIAVVDIGYHGTMQYALQEVIAAEGWDVSVKGYYVGVDPDARFIREGKIAAEGYLYGSDGGADIKKAVDSCSTLFETQYLGRHGSVKRFSTTDGKSDPVYLPYEYEPGEGQKVDEEAIIGRYQAGAFAFARYMLGAMPYDGFDINPNTAIYSFVRQGMRPTNKEARFWGDMRFFNYGKSYIACPRSALYYLAHWKVFKIDFMTCGWKIGFMRRLFRIPLPYDRIYTILKKKYNEI